MIAFIDDHRDKHGVEPICEVLPIAPATYYEHLARRVDPARLSDRARRDAQLRPQIQRVFDANWQVYGVRKIWRQLRREGFDVARCTVARLMKDMGIQGIIRGKPQKTTIPDKKLPCPMDKVNRQFQGASAEHAVGVGFHLRRNLEGVRLCCLRHRRICPAHRGLAGQQHPSCRVRAGCPRTGRP
jgi:hypothetical protein